MKTSTRTRFGIGTATVVAGLALFSLAGPASPASAYGTSEGELASACADGINEVGVSVHCTFEADHVSSYNMIWNRYGDPVSNCDNPFGEVKLTIVASRSFTQTWTAGGKFGISWGGMGLEGNASYSESTTTTSGVNREIVAQTGQKNAATVGTEMAVEEGRIRVDIMDSFGSDYVSTDTHYINGAQRTVPTGKQQHGSDPVYCGQNFTVDPENTPV
ncbi:hypothetical protein ACFXQA_14525 [Microbacterium sp. P07]|uniref:hypothetical protein n=1 Tax=Microbacterium sp. P07 TaxID=3366952 RepID=UPI0037475D4C